MIRVLVCLWIMNRRKKHHCSQQNKENTRRWNRHFSLHHHWMLGNRHFILHVDRLLIPDKRKELVHNKNQTIMSRLSSSPKTTLWDFPLPHHLSEMAFIHICFIKSCLFHSYHSGYHVLYSQWLSCHIYCMVIMSYLFHGYHWKTRLCKDQLLFVKTTRISYDKCVYSLSICFNYNHPNMTGRKSLGIRRSKFCCFVSKRAYLLRTKFLIRQTSW